jgi:hypothetical protein
MPTGRATFSVAARPALETPLQQLTMFVTQDGRWVLPDSDEFLAALGDPQPDYDAPGFAVRNLGFVKFQILDRVVTEIELHPRNVELPALLTVERRLAEAGTSLFRIKYLEDEWRSEISASAEHTIVRLRELCVPVFEAPKTERFYVEPRDPDILFSQAHRNEGLGAMAMKWRVAFGNFDSTVLDIASRHDLLGHFALASFEPHDGRPVFKFLGGGHRWAGDSYRFDGLDRPIEQMPDREYGAWTSGFYKSLGGGGPPRYDVITAQMQYHGETGTPRRTRTYERLLLPWRTPSGEVLVTSCAKLLPSEASANLSVSASESSVSRKVPKSL